MTGIFANNYVHGLLLLLVLFIDRTVYKTFPVFDFFFPFSIDDSKIKRFNNRRENWKIDIKILRERCN